MNEVLVTSAGQGCKLDAVLVPERSLCLAMSFNTEVYLPSD